MEQLLRIHFPIRRGQASGKVHFVRYAEDFIVTGVSRETLEGEVKPLLENFLAERGLHLSAEKTKITPIEVGFDFLGQNVRKYGEKRLIRPSQSSQQSFRDKIRTLLKKLQCSPQDMVIGKLNPVIRGWGYYHRHVVSRYIFHKMDHWIWERLWHWCCRRHPRKKNRHWIAKCYFVRQGTRGWIFQASQRVVKGKIIRRAYQKGDPPPTLQMLTDILIVRHVKIKHDANPYDPDSLSVSFLVA